MVFKRSKIYYLWADLKQRAKKQNTYVCKEWYDSFEVFKEWAYSNGYVEGKKTLVRKDKNLGLEPNNCEFVDRYSNHKTHGESKGKLYIMWSSLKQKCYNEKSPTFASFGGINIKLSEEWHSFDKFKEWAYENGYEEGLLLDRINPRGDFEPKNCFFTEKSKHSSVINSKIIKRGQDNYSYKHGMNNTRLYNIWDSMKQRCLNPRNKDYKNYGGRGISIVEEWLSFENFHKWALENGYSEELTIDREDVNGNYEPINCSWKTVKEQSNNKRKNHFVTIGNETKTIAQWSEISGVPPKTLRYRIVNGWKEEDLLSKPDRTKKRSTKGGVNLSK